MPLQNAATRRAILPSTGRGREVCVVRVSVQRVPDKCKQFFIGGGPGRRGGGAGGYHGFRPYVYGGMQLKDRVEKIDF